MEKNEIRRLPFEALKTFCRQAYQKVGVPPMEAEIVGRPPRAVRPRGVETHGLPACPFTSSASRRDTSARKPGSRR